MKFCMAYFHKDLEKKGFDKYTLCIPCILYAPPAPLSPFTSATFYRRLGIPVSKSWEKYDR